MDVWIIFWNNDEIFGIYSSEELMRAALRKEIEETMNYDEAEEDYGYTKEELLEDTEREVPFIVGDLFYVQKYYMTLPLKEEIE